MMNFPDKKIKEACELMFNPKISYSGKDIKKLAEEYHKVYSSVKDETQLTYIESLGELIYRYIYYGVVDSIAIDDDLYYFVSYGNNNVSHMYKLVFFVDRRNDPSNEKNIDNETIKKMIAKINSDIKYAVDEAKSTSNRFMLKDGNFIDEVDPVEIQKWFDKYLEYYIVSGFANNFE